MAQDVPNTQASVGFFHSTAKRTLTSNRMHELNVEYKRIVRYRTDSQLTRWLAAIILVLEHHWCCKICKNNHSSIHQCYQWMCAQRLHVKVKVFLVQHNTAPHQYSSSDYLIVFPLDQLWILGPGLWLHPVSVILECKRFAPLTAPSSGLSNIEQTHIWSRITNIY